MAPAPVLKATTAQAEISAGVTYHVDGELVPALTVELSSVPVYFEHHILLWKDPRTNIGIKALAGAFKRVLSGMPVFMTEAHGPGRIAFSRDGVGHVFGMHLQPDDALAFVRRERVNEEAGASHQDVRDAFDARERRREHPDGRHRLLH